MTDILSTSPAASPAHDGHGADFATLMLAADVQEAQILASLLATEGIHAHVNQAAQAQMTLAWATSHGGVQVQVPVRHAARARALLAELRSGAFALDGDPDPALGPAPVATHTALWNPDFVAFLGLWFTPVFATLLHFVNARALGDRALVARAQAWLGLSVIATLATFWLLREHEWTTGRPFEASSLLVPFTIVWYLAAGHAQSRHVARAHGTRYVHRSVLHAVVIAFVMMLAVGSAGTMITVD